MSYGSLSGSRRPIAPAAHDDQPDAATFQERSRVHMLAIAKNDPTDVPERRDRFHEEALEVVHKLGSSREDAHRLVDYVWGRPAGDLRQEIGQALKTLADLASETGHDMMACGEEELARTWQPEVFAKIQRKRANRHGRGPLPGVDGGLVTTSAPGEDLIEAFARDCLIMQPGDFLACQAAYKAFAAWCDRKGRTAFKIQSFYGRLGRLAPHRRGYGGGIGFGDVRLKDEVPDDITPEAVSTLQAGADAEMKGETWETIDSPEIKALRDLAHVLTAHMEEGQITPAGREMVSVALDRVFPKLLHTRERCEMAECLVHGGCDECPTEAQVEAADAKLTAWLAEHPREVVIHKTQNVGKTEMLPDLRPWQPAGAYPVDGTIIEVEGRPGRMRYCLDKTTANNAKNRLGGWLSDAGDDRSWFTTHAPTGRWRKASPVRV